MLKAINSILFYVRDLDASAEFYTKLGMSVSRHEDHVLAEVGDFSVQLFDESKVQFKQDSDKPEKGTGVFVYIECDDIDGQFRHMKDEGLNPSSEPTDHPWGKREFAIKDPDGYRLVFYKLLD